MDKEQQLENLEQGQDLSIEQAIEEPVSEATPSLDSETKPEVAAKTDVEAVRADNVEVNIKSPVKKILQGKVTSNKSDKTIVVAVVRQIRHPLYKKYFKRTKRFMAHDPNNECKVGDVVRIKEHRPISKMKRWMLVDVVTKAK